MSTYYDASFPQKQCFLMLNQLVPAGDLSESTGQNANAVLPCALSCICPRRRSYGISARYITLLPPNVFDRRRQASTSARLLLTYSPLRMYTSKGNTYPAHRRTGAPRRWFQAEPSDRRRRYSGSGKRSLCPNRHGRFVPGRGQTGRSDSPRCPGG